jgi:DNA-binding MarR family transcriptional regulator
VALKVPIRIKGDVSTTGLEAERLFDATEWLSLHARAESALRVVVARAIKQFGLTVTDWTIINTLANDESGEFTVTRIGEVFDVNTPQAVGLVKDLVKRSLVRQKVSSKDRRVKYLIITRSGKKLAYDAEQSILHAMRYWLFDLSDSEIEQYIAVQRKLIDFDIPD